MATSPSPFPRAALLPLFALGAALLGFLGGLSVQWTPMGQDASGKAVREYLLEHPEILPEAMNRLQQKETAARLAPLRKQIVRPFPGAVLGNPAGSKVLIEFSDYACGYCRQSVPEVDALIAADPQLKVVIREFPILSPESETAARMALAAAEQGKFGAFHRAMFALGRPSAQTIAQAAQQAGIDPERAARFARSSVVESELAMNMRIAETMGFTGTPSWIAGDTVLAGAVGKDALAQAIAGTAQR